MHVKQKSSLIKIHGGIKIHIPPPQEGGIVIDNYS
jgi:hypothetical protein